MLLGSAQDHKRVGDGDTGPNTGGMGAYSPAPGFTAGAGAACMERIIRPALAEMARRGTPFRGVLFAGLMLTADGPKLIEFNVRFGDPECQVLLIRLKVRPAAGIAGGLRRGAGDFDLRWHDTAALPSSWRPAAIPDAPERGSTIHGLAEAARGRG